MEGHNMVKLNIACYFHGVLSMLGENKFDWDEIDKLFNEELGRRKQRTLVENTETIIIEASIHDIIVEVKKRNMQAIRLLHFFNSALQDLSILLSPLEKKLVVKSLWDLLTTFNKNYLNFTGEMLILNNLIKTGKYRLTGIEYLLPNNKSVDFQLLDIDENTVVLVEVLNIHLKDGKVEKQNDLLGKFLTKRITDKIEAKNEGLKEKVDFELVPVLWGAASDLKVYCDYFKLNNMQIVGVHEAFAFASFMDSLDGQKFEGRFMRLSKLFDNSRPIVFK